MLLVIHNLPARTQYSDIKEFIKSQCGLRDFIIDNLHNEGASMRVTVGVSVEEDAAILIRKINGLYYRGQQLYVADNQQKTETNQPCRKSMLQPEYMQNAQQRSHIQSQSTHDHKMNHEEEQFKQTNMLQPEYMQNEQPQVQSQPQIQNQTYDYNAQVQALNKYQQMGYMYQMQAVGQQNQYAYAQQASQWPNYLGWNQNQVNTNQDNKWGTTTHINNDPQLPASQSKDNNHDSKRSKFDSSSSQNEYSNRHDRSRDGNKFEQKRSSISSQRDSQSKDNRNEHTSRKRRRNKRSSSNRRENPSFNQHDEQSRINRDKHSGIERDERSGINRDKHSGINRDKHSEIIRSEHSFSKPQDFPNFHVDLNNQGGNIVNQRDSQLFNQRGNYSDQNVGYSEPYSGPDFNQQKYSSDQISGYNINQRDNLTGQFNNLYHRRDKYSSQNDNFSIQQESNLSQSYNQQRGNYSEYQQGGLGFSQRNNYSLNQDNDHSIGGFGSNYSEQHGGLDTDSSSQFKNYSSNQSRSYSNSQRGNSNNNRGSHLTNNLGGHSYTNREDDSNSMRGGHFNSNRGGHFNSNRGGHFNSNRGGHSYSGLGIHSNSDHGGHSNTNLGSQSNSNLGVHSNSNRGGHSNKNRGGQSNTSRGGHSNSNLGGQASNCKEHPPNKRGGLYGQSGGLSSNNRDGHFANQNPNRFQNAPTHPVAILSAGDETKKLLLVPAGNFKGDVKKQPENNLTPQPQPIKEPKIPRFPLSGPGSRKKKRKGKQAPPPPNLPDKIPNYPQSDKKLHSKQKRQEKLEMETLDGYKVTTHLQAAIDEEVAAIGALLKYEFANPRSDDEKVAFTNVNPGTCINKCRKFVAFHLSKRITNQGLKMCRIYGSPMRPKRRHLLSFLSKFNCLSLRTTVKGNQYLIASFDSYDVIDHLCSISPVDIGNGLQVTFKPMHVAPPNRKVHPKKLKSLRKHYINQIKNMKDDSLRVDLLDKDWPVKEEEIRKATEEKRKQEEANAGKEPENYVTDEIVTIYDEDIVGIKDTKNEHKNKDAIDSCENKVIDDDCYIIDEKQSVVEDNTNKDENVVSTEDWNEVGENWDNDGEDWGDETLGQDGKNEENSNYDENVADIDLDNVDEDDLEDY